MNVTYKKIWAAIRLAHSAQSLGTLTFLSTGPSGYSVLGTEKIYWNLRRETSQFLGKRLIKITICDVNNNLSSVVESISALVWDGKVHLIEHQHEMVEEYKIARFYVRLSGERYP